jgi:hypothetical protein
MSRNAPPMTERTHLSETLFPFGKGFFLVR